MTLAYERSKYTNTSGRPSLKALKDEMQPFVKEFGGAPVKAFDRGAIVGISSKNLGLNQGYPEHRFVEVALRSGWSGPQETKSPYSTSYKFCKERLSLFLTKVKNDYWVYNMHWVSDERSDLYCNSNPGSAKRNMFSAHA